MKKKTLLLLTLVPILIGEIINLTILIPGIGSITFFLMPWLTLAFWLYLGMQFAKTDWSFLPSILMGNAVGILSLAVYLWQYLVESEENINGMIVGLSQMFTTGTPRYLFVRLAMKFESEPNYIGPTTMVGVEIIAVSVMIVIFAAGYLWEKAVCRRAEQF